MRCISSHGGGKAVSEFAWECRHCKNLLHSTYCVLMCEDKNRNTPACEFVEREEDAYREEDAWTIKALRAELAQLRRVAEAAKKVLPLKTCAVDDCANCDKGYRFNCTYQDLHDSLREWRGQDKEV